MSTPCSRLEVCVDSVASAIIADASGASRIELCSSLLEGGVTPSAGLIRTVMQRVSLPVCVLIRPRAGDFCYTEAEYNVMLSDIEYCRELDVYGVVVGCLKQDGSVDEERLREMCEYAGNMHVTFHRAIDVSSDPLLALDTCIRVGCARVLTSGGKQTCLQGKDMIERMVDRAANRIVVMAGGGITEDNLPSLLSSNIPEFHASLRCAVHSDMQHTVPNLFMGGEKINQPLSEYTWKQADATKIEQCVRLLVQHR